MGVAAGGCRYQSSDVECGDARVRAQIRSVAAVITVTGRLDATNVEAVVGQLCRYVHLDDPLVLDVHDVDIDGDGGGIFERLVSAFGAECHWGGVDWVLVAQSADLPSSSEDDEHIVWAESVPEALAHFAWVIDTRRHLPLPGLK